MNSGALQFHSLHSAVELLAESSSVFFFFYIRMNLCLGPRGLQEKYRCCTLSGNVQFQLFQQ